MDSKEKQKEIIEKHLSDQKFVDSLFYLIDVRIENLKQKTVSQGSKGLLDELGDTLKAKGGCLALNELKMQLQKFIPDQA